MDEDQKPRPPVVRGARACTTCRAAKMKCVGADDGQKQCQRCARTSVECIFEKHRRGRKPGSKLSEASKMLRKLEKGLNTAKAKSDTMASYPDPRGASQYSNGSHYGPSPSHFLATSLPSASLQHQYSQDYPNSSHSSRTMDGDDDDENDADRNDDNIFPAKVVRKEKERSFFDTILNPEHTKPDPNRPGTSYSPPVHGLHTHPDGLTDPITAGIIDEPGAKVLFDLIFLRLNPFINLFEPALHSVHYVREKCPFLFTTLIMAGCKFFRPALFKQCQQLANDYAVKSFAEGWKSIEVVQAFVCLTYWRDSQDHNCTWTYVGYACRMAVELGLNRYVAHPPPHETEMQLLQRRNWERTYLVLFVHDRSLSTQTGRHWMLPTDEFVQHASTWHEGGGSSIRAEDVIVAAFVHLRNIATDTTELFHNSGGSGRGANEILYESGLRNCNLKLTQWLEQWNREMQRASGETFHFAFLNFFRLYVRLFLNSFGLHDSATSAGPVQALNVCYSSAIDSLRIISKEFASMSMLAYSQESISTMSAYSAVFLLKLLRSTTTLPQLHDSATHEVHTVISQAADAYHEASTLSPASTATAYHSRFLRSLLANDTFSRRNEATSRYDMNMPSIDPRLQGSSTSQPPFHFPASPHVPPHPLPARDVYMESPLRSGGGQGSLANAHILPYNGTGQPERDDSDHQYWKNMFVGLGFGNNIDSSSSDDARGYQQSALQYTQ